MFHIKHVFKLKLILSPHLFSTDVPNLVVMVTDGESNISPFETLPEANRIKRSGTSIITVAVGLSSNAELVGLTSPPISDNLIYVDDFEALHRLSDQIVAPLCSGEEPSPSDPLGQCRVLGSGRVNHSNNYNICFKGKVEETSERQGEACVYIYGFFRVCAGSILSWAELN